MQEDIRGNKEEVRMTLPRWLRWLVVLIAILVAGGLVWLRVGVNPDWELGLNRGPIGENRFDFVNTSLVVDISGVSHISHRSVVPGLPASGPCVPTDAGTPGRAHSCIPSTNPFSLNP